MKNNVIRIAVSLSWLSIALSGTACNGPDTAGPSSESSAPPPAPDVAPAPTAPATAPTSGIQVTVPDGWTKVTPSSVPAQYMKGTTTFIAKTEPIPDTDLDAIAAKATAMFEKSFTNMAVQGTPERLTVGAQDARKIVFTCEISGMSMKYIYVYLKSGGATWALTFGGLADSFNSLNTDYQAILNSIRFL